jgi:hypothetical protein
MATRVRGANWPYACSQHNSSRSHSEQGFGGGTYLGRSYPRPPVSRRPARSTARAPLAATYSRRLR